MKKDASIRFWEKVNKNCKNGCWEWQAHLHKGYGQFGDSNRKIVYAHRYSYELEHGTISAGLELDHLCCNPRCVNPTHLEPVTRQENIRRIISKPRRFIDLAGQKFHRWLVQESVYDPKYKRWSWLCLCDCGNTGLIAVNRLTRGRSKSCGFLKREALVESWRTLSHSYLR